MEPNKRNKLKEEITILQINAGRAFKTVAEIRAAIDKEGIQITLIQEPYTLKGKITNYGTNARIISSQKKDQKVWSAIIVSDKSLTVMKRKI